MQQVSLVINYDLPNNRENYIHRYGLQHTANTPGLYMKLRGQDLAAELVMWCVIPAGGGGDSAFDSADVVCFAGLVVQVVMDVRVWPSTL